jgi:hypothetical protein
MENSFLSMLDFGGYFFTMLFHCSYIHVISHNFFILNAIYILASEGILCFCLCILTLLTL